MSTRRNSPDADRTPPSNHPDTSTNTSTGTDVDTHTSPDASTGTTTAFGDTAPAAKFTDDVDGFNDPHGHTTKNPASTDRNAVTFNATPTAEPGTPATPVTGTRNTVLGTS